MEIKLDAMQRAAVDCALSSSTMVLTGGPGTGKTTVCKEILHALESQGRYIACASPTGKAAKRLAEQTGRPAKTIHRLLEWTYEAMWFTRDSDNPLPENVVLIDEASMLDTEMLHAVLDAMRLGSKLILVGDADQLPSISAGNVLRDIIASGTVPVVRLTEIYRQSSNSWICENARRINAGERLHIDNEHSEDFFFIEKPDAQQAAETIAQLSSFVLPERHGLDPVTDIQILTPQKKGPIGVAVLNTELQARMNPPGPGRREWRVNKDTVFRVGDRVMHTKNNYQLLVFNGEVGRVSAIDDCLSVDFGDRTVVYDRSTSVQLMLCYASTIHKSQGSEYPCVIIGCHSSHWYMLSRPLLYTAVTRAQRFVYIVGDHKGLKRAIDNNEIVERHTALRERLVEAA